MTWGNLAWHVHGLMHAHSGWEKEGVGEFTVCESRIPFSGKAEVCFRPALQDAGWSVIPAIEMGGELLVTLMSAAPDPYTAMALLREGVRQLEAA